MAEIPDDVRKQIIERTLNRVAMPAIVEGTFTPEPVVDPKVAGESATEAVVSLQGKSLLEQTLENHEKVGNEDVAAIDEARKELIAKTDPSKVAMILGAILR